MAEAVTIVEVAPRDGLQNEKAVLPPHIRAQFIERLIEAGLRVIEAGSFVSPRWTPQMAGTDEVLRKMGHRPGISLPVLVPNEQGLDAAIEAGARQIAVFGAASETFSRKNINCSIAESLARFRPVVRRALSKGLGVRGYVSCVLGCPYEGEAPVAKVVEVARALAEMGCEEISLGDTIGAGSPPAAWRMFRAVARDIPASKLAVHFHDTGGRALANIEACLEEGARIVDAAAGGLGGCPYAPGAKGNVATEGVVSLLSRLGFETGIDLRRLQGATCFIRSALAQAERDAANLH
jgi:isopropylmalate/homocitrate/citramalate synthase